MAQRQNDTVVNLARSVTLTQRQNDTLHHFATVRHFGTATKRLRFILFTNFILGF